MDLLAGGVGYFKSKFKTDEFDDKLNQAVSEENWQASTQLLHQIANASYNNEKQQRILAFISEKLKSKSWKKVLKTLHLVDFLLKNGPTSIVNTLKQNIYDFRSFDNYTLIAEGVDRGQSIRKQSRLIVDLLSEDHLLNDERAKAKQIKERMANVIGSGAYYGSYSNEGPTSGSKNTTSTYESFGSQNYKGSGSGYGGGNLSFGESVMKTLQQSKKLQRKEQVPPPAEQKPAGKLNLSKMNERKPQQNKKIFNNLNVKLVKPPQKKPASTKPQISQKVSPPSIKNDKSFPSTKQNKAGQSIDIMDLDLISYGNSAPNPVSTNQPPQKNNAFDFLGGFSQPNNQLNPTLEKPSYDTSFNIGLGNPATLNKPQSTIQTVIQPPLTDNFLFSVNPSTNSPQKSYENLQFNFQSTQNKNVPISLSNPEPKVAKSQQANNLIDFSNFREQLNSIGRQQQKKSMVQSWNW